MREVVSGRRLWRPGRDVLLDLGAWPSRRQTVRSRRRTTGPCSRPTTAATVSGPTRWAATAGPIAPRASCSPDLRRTDDMTGRCRPAADLAAGRPRLRRLRPRRDPPDPLLRPEPAAGRHASARPRPSDRCRSPSTSTRARRPTRTTETLTYAWDLDGDGAYDDGTASRSTARTRPPVPSGRSARHRRRGVCSRDRPPDGPRRTRRRSLTDDGTSRGLTWRVGDTINFSATGSDAQDGTLGSCGVQLDVRDDALPGWRLPLACHPGAEPGRAPARSSRRTMSIPRISGSP